MLLSPRVRGRWFITPHAVKRYQSRICPGMTYEQAREDLIAESERAHFVRRGPGLPGVSDLAELWRGGKPKRMRFVVMPADGSELPQLVTVLAPHVGWAP